MTGIGRYMVGLCTAMSEVAPADSWSFDAIGPRERTPPEWLPDGVGYKSARVPRGPLRFAWAATGRPRLERLVGNFDLLHVLHPTTEVPTGGPSVVTFHDVMPLQHPEWYTPIVAWAARRAAESVSTGTQPVIAVSAHTAQLVTEVAGVDPLRITVIHEAVDDRFRAPISTDGIAAACHKYGVRPGEYFISVGALSARKNFSTLVRAMSEMEDQSVSLLLCGKPFGDEGVISDEIDRYHLSARVSLPGFVSDQDLRPLVSGAVALVQPSVDEGFSLPPLEAMGSGTPVVVSDAGSHPEIVADAGLLVDPHDSSGWARALDSMVADEGLRARLRTLGEARASQFSWQKAAARTLEVYESALEDRGR